MGMDTLSFPRSPQLVSVHTRTQNTTVSKVAPWEKQAHRMKTQHRPHLAERMSSFLGAEVWALGPGRERASGLLMPSPAALPSARCRPQTRLQERRPHAPRA